MNFDWLHRITQLTTILIRSKELQSLYNVIIKCSRFFVIINTFFQYIVIPSSIYKCMSQQVINYHMRLPSTVITFSLKKK